MLAFAFLATVFETRLLGSHRRPVGAALYLIIGFIFGPEALAFLTSDSLQVLSGMEAVVSAFIGMSCGLPLGMRGLDLHRPDRVGFGIMMMVVTTVLVAGAAYIAFLWWPGLGLSDEPGVLVAALTFGVAAAVSSPNVMREAVCAHLSDGPVSRLMPTALMTSRFLAVFVFGVLAAFIPGTPVGSVPTAVAAIASGLGIGIAFHIMVGAQNDPHRLMVATLGSLTLGAGIAESLSLAPLMVGLMSGLTVGVLSPASESIAGTIRRLERPAVVALFLFGGAHFSLNDPHILVLPIAYVVVRVVALRIAAACSRPISKDLEQDVPGLWRSYLYQGTLTAAVALNFEALMPGQVGTLLESTLLVAAIVNPFVSWNAARDLLRDVGETGRQRPEPCEPTSPATTEVVEAHI
jgi:hypothetical protein